MTVTGVVSGSTVRGRRMTWMMDGVCLVGSGVAGRGAYRGLDVWVEDCRRTLFLIVCVAKALAWIVGTASCSGSLE